MKYEDSKTLPNCKGGKESCMEIAISTTEGQKFIDPWSWKVTISLKRNGGYLTSVTRKTEGKLSQLIDEIVDLVVDEVNNKFSDDSCNVDPDIIVDWINSLRGNLKK